MNRTCAAKLNAARRAALKAGNPADEGIYIEWHGDHAKVCARGAKVLWEGETHCSACAKVEAIKAQQPQGALL